MTKLLQRRLQQIARNHIIFSDQDIHERRDIGTDDQRQEVLLTFKFGISLSEDLLPQSLDRGQAFPIRTAQ